ncbi:MAG: site-specific DNA-methyltransferase [Ruminococcus sp.]|nr:site-specific DNA-methyltransferase [Ruminococcus sp.]MCM1478440.1 site-specific DNA-methyltransferase [Muribaculaceae bacterium]
MYERNDFMDVIAANAVIKPNFCNKCDGIELLGQINDNSLKAVFFDPQYRGVLDKMKYGNEGKQRGRARSALEQMSAETITAFLNEINRVLNPSGYLFLWVDKFHLVEGVTSWFDGTSLEPVDMITWNKLKIGMGYRTRRQAEYLVVAQKLPKLAKATWTIHNIPDVWDEKVPKTHAHSKPVELQKRLILATTNAGDFVCDPASGGYSVFEACKQTDRNFIGGDIEYGESAEV